MSPQGQRRDQKTENLRFWKQKCEHLNRELLKMRKIEQMFKRNRRETESKLKRLELNLYFGSLNEAHLMKQFDLKQLFEIQSAYNIKDAQQCAKSNKSKSGTDKCSKCF